MLIVQRRQVVSSGTLWTPTAISTALWLDASDSSSITQSSGLVGQWRDKKNNGISAVSSGSDRPTTGTRTINGLNTIDFAAVTSPIVTFNTMSFTSVPLAGSTSAIAVMAFQLDADPPTSVNQAGPLLGSWGSGSDDLMCWTDGNNYNGWMSSARKNCGNPSPSMAASVCIASFVSANGLFEVYINGLLLYTTASNTYAIGSSPNIGGSSTYFLDGRVAEIVVVANSTASSTRQFLEGYMAGPTRWSAQSSLPAGHPYKSAAPTI